MFFHRSDGTGPSRERPVRGRLLLPLLPLRDIVVFPHMVVPLFVGRESSVAALEEAMRHDRRILLSAQKQARLNEPTPEDIHTTGTIGQVVQMLRLPDGTVKVLAEGKRRARIEEFVSRSPFYLCSVQPLSVPPAEGVEVEALMRSVRSSFEAYARLNRRVPPEALATAQSAEDPSQLADHVVVHLSGVKLADRQQLLETLDPVARLERLLALLGQEIEILEVERKIRTRVKKRMERTQKEHYLNEQMAAIQRELGERDEFRSELQELEAQLRKKRLSAEAREKVRKELRKLKMMQPMSAEATVVRHYLDWILALPWGEKSEENRDIEAAERVLEEDHYGLKKVKQRILEHLAVCALSGKVRGPVLCLVGPPGVGKTSLARSIARATGRKFVRLSLGGVRDEAEIRGHRRTYIGALPGRIVQSLRKCGTDNPVFLLDEVDKMSSDFRGDPAAALLEVLDPEQNASFNDHYLELDYDLSDILFVTTANTLGGIPLPLRDRMEVIELTGYTDFEKLNIATRYLVPRQREEAGLGDVEVTFSEAALGKLVHHYTKESGVRNLEREIGSICRKIARKVLAEGGPRPGLRFEVAAEDVATYLGPHKFEPGKAARQDQVGVVHGLAYTSTGGELLECEVAIVPGKGKLLITGLLEKGMQESAQAAMSYVRSRHRVFGLAEDFHEKMDVHVHFPEFVPKDGPSAGITIATAIASAVLDVPVRRTVAMTGEITLRGRVLPIGGLEEKLLAAYRAGIETVLLPRENRKDLHEVPDQVLRALRLVLVEHMDEVLREALMLGDPDAFFGTRRRPPLEYRDGKALEPADPDADAGLPAPTVEPTGTRQ